MKYPVFIAALAVSLISVAPLHAQEMTKDRLIGTWKVVSLKSTSGDKVAYPLGEKVAGYVTITPTRYWLLFVDSTRARPAAPTLTDAEAAAMMKTQAAWTGKYTTGEQTADGLKLIAHVDVASSQAIAGMDRVYFARRDGDKLVMKSPGVVVPMTGAVSVVEFEMVKSD